MRKILKRLALVFATAGLAIASQSALAEEYPELNLRMAHFVPSTYAGAQWEQWWADEVTKRSGGKIKVKIFWAGSLGGPTEILKLTGSGAVQLGATAQGYFVREMPLAGAAGNLMIRTHQSGKDAMDTWKKFQADSQVKDELSRNGVVLLTHQGSAPYRLTCTKPIATISDLKGLRIRVPATLYMSEWWVSLGAVPVSIPYSEMYDALQKGTVDCSWAAHDQVIPTKIHEVAKFAIDLNTGSHAVWGIFANKKLFEDTWPKTVSSLMTEVSEDMMRLQLEEIESVEANTINVDFPKHGVTYVEFKEKDLVDKSAINTIDLWEKYLESKGLTDAAKRLGPILRAKQESFND